MGSKLALRGKGRFFKADGMTVKKTGPKGHLIYCNDIFLRINNESRDECPGRPLNMIRHPGMPRCVFQKLWNDIQSGCEIFAFVLNKTKRGDHYWVLAHVAPGLNVEEKIIGYHSNRPVPDRNILENTIMPLYEKLLIEKKRHSIRKKGLMVSVYMLAGILSENGMEYDEFVARI